MFIGWNALDEYTAKGANREDFINPREVSQKEMERERQKRCCVALWAYAYEEMSKSLVSDAKFDKVCLEIDPTIITDRPEVDTFFRKDFHPCTGSWYGKHPEYDKLVGVYIRMTKGWRVFREYQRSIKDKTRTILDWEIWLRQNK